MAPPIPPPLLPGEPDLPPNEENALSDTWLDRHPPLADFVAWAADDAPAARLRSLVGPPGIGKTTYLKQFKKELHAQDSDLIFLLPPLNLYPCDEARYRAWVNEVVKAANAQGYPLTAPPPQSSFRDAWMDVAGQLPAACLVHKPVLMLDGFDELDADNRKVVEQHVLIPFLIPAVDDCQNRVVLARRDEYALVEGVLRWEDQAISLDPLDDAKNQPAEQIQKLLAKVAGQTPDEARRLLEWLDAPEAAIATAIGLDDAGREALVHELAPALLVSPLVNLVLLHQRLIRGAELTADDFRACLKAYVSRARHGKQADKLDEWTDKLITFTAQLPDPNTFKLEKDTPDAELIGECAREGIIAQNPGTARYCLDPVVIALAHHIQPAPQPQPPVA